MTMTNTGLIDIAIRSLVANRIGVLSVTSVPDDHEWGISVCLSETIGFNFYVTEELFQKFKEQNISTNDQIKILIDYVFGLVEKDIMSTIHISSKSMLMN